MADANMIQHNMTLEEMFSLLSHMGAEPEIVDDNTITSRTICHGGDSHKLYYYDNSKRFTCYTGNCGRGFSIYDLIQMQQGCGFIESLRFVEDFFGLDSKSNTGFYDKNNRLDFSFFKKFSEDELSTNKPTPSSYDESILNHFNELYHIDWINDHIHKSAMKRFGILFHISGYQVIIPHRDIKGDLIGVRVRNLKPEVVDKGMKYMPLIYNNQIYRHSLGQNLYGLYENKDNINKTRRVIIFESEKSVLQLESYWGQKNIAVALCGSSLSEEQISMLHELNINEVVIALDKEFKENGSSEELLYANEIKEKILYPLSAFFQVSIVWDNEDILEYKDSPSDKGQEVWEYLFENRTMLGGC